MPAHVAAVKNIKNAADKMSRLAYGFGLIALRTLTLGKSPRYEVTRSYIGGIQ